MYMRDYDTYLSGVGLPAIYTVVVIGQPRRKAWTFVVAGCIWLFAVACATLLQSATGFSVANATGMVVFLLATVFAGVIVRNRHEIFLDTEARADRAEADQLATAERAVATERLRIAREMHDVVAHGMSVIAVQAAAAKESFETRPDRTFELLDSIELTGRESLAEMRRMLGVLRSGADGNDERGGPELAPQPSLADLERLVASCTEAGTPTELHVSGEPVRIAPGIDLAAFRIVQEALTNVLKHGGTKATARVELVYEPTQIQISVLDTGRGSIVKPAPPGSGNGLIGMRERVDVYGGELSAGPRAGGGYVVVATLPLATKDDRPRVESSDDTRERTQ
jgi:signal transduction histidine kinase